MAKRALISVSDKTGIVEFAKELSRIGYEIISTGGTFQILREQGLDVINISTVTSFPECLDGRIKTLHPKVHAGILAIRENSSHMDALRELDIQPIDLVAVNLYPFREAISKEDVTMEEAIENIDIGGPTMLRAAAKNHGDVVVIVNPEHYSQVLNELKESGSVFKETKLLLAAKVFEHTAQYDALIANYLLKKSGQEGFPQNITQTYEKIQDLSYGENPHQKAAFYRDLNDGNAGVGQARQLHGKTLSFNNLNDANAAIELLAEFSEPCAVAIKHATPCGVGTGENILEAYRKAYEADTVSIFGGIVAVNRSVDALTAYEMNKIFLEIVIAPSFEEEALEILKQKKNIRLLELPETQGNDQKRSLDYKKIRGGLLLQEADDKVLEENSLKYVTAIKPDEGTMKDLIMAMKVVKHTKSNGIVLVKEGMTVGVGPGQTNRITAANIAIEIAKDRAEGAVMASDAFFPFSDCVTAAHQAGIKSIIQPGGSIRDEDSIEACDRYGISMVFTGMRHFKH